MRLFCHRAVLREHTGHSLWVGVLLLVIPFSLTGAAVRLKGISLAGPVYRQGHGDNWYLTWAADDRLYVGMDDGTVLDRGVNHCAAGRNHAGAYVVDGDVEINNRVWRLLGHAPDFRAKRLPGYPVCPSKSNWYIFGMLAVSNTIYTLVTESQHGWNGSQLIYSPDGGATWKDNQDRPVDWRRPHHEITWYWRDSPNRAFALSTFLQMGRGYTDNTDGFVYVYGANAGSDGPGEIDEDRQRETVLARAPISRIRQPAAYEYFSGWQEGRPTWSKSIARRRPVVIHPAGYSRGYAWIPSVTYIPPLDTYLMTTGAMEGRNRGRPPIFILYQAPGPCGPWQEIYRDSNWRVGDAESIPYNPIIVPKGISADGKSMWLLSSDIKGWPTDNDWSHVCLSLYSFNLQKMVLQTAADPEVRTRKATDQ